MRASAIIDILEKKLISPSNPYTVLAAAVKVLNKNHNSGWIKKSKQHLDDWIEETCHII